MPFVNSKVTVKLTQDDKEVLKGELGKAVASILGKAENWIMIGFEDECSLYFKGNNDKPSAFVEVKIFGSASHDKFNQLTARICDIFQSRLSIPSDRIYVKYEEVDEWGWNGGNF